MQYVLTMHVFLLFPNYKAFIEVDNEIHDDDHYFYDDSHDVHYSNVGDEIDHYANFEDEMA